MIKFILCFFILSVIPLSNDILIAQSDVIEVIGGLIEDGKIDEADKKIEEYLKKYPDDVDVLMMKGNVLFYHFQNSHDYIQVSVNEDESIYNSSIGFIQAPIIVLPEKNALEIASFWNNALIHDPSRKDIHMGLCYIYSMSLMKDSLIKQLKILRELFPEDMGLKYNMGDYARMFNERDKYSECMEIYLNISSLYPYSAGIYSDIAAMYFKEGDLVKAQKFLEKAVIQKDVDQMCLQNSAMVNTVLGNYSEALSNLIRLSKINSNSYDWLIYKALYERVLEEENWKDNIEEYIEKVPGSSENSEIELARFINTNTESDIEAYDSLLSKVKNSLFLFLINEHAKNYFRDSFKPLFNCAELHTYYNNHNIAVKIYGLIETKNIAKTDDETEKLNFYYAWSLYKNGQKEKSIQKWENLLNSDDFYKKSAAAYFIGNHYQELGNKTEALKYYKLVSDRASDSKYATYCWNRLIQ